MAAAKGKRLVALIRPQAGGYVAHIFPAGIVCFSENLDGLGEEIRTALADYRASAEEFAGAGEGFALSLSQSEWDDAAEASTFFYLEPEGDYVH